LDASLARICADKPLNALVFAGPLNGYLMRPDTSASRQSWWLTALRDAGIDRLTPHDLKHTAASLAVSAGANVKALQRMLGHKSAAMTLDTYADLFDDDLGDVAERLNDRVMAKNVGKMWARIQNEEEKSSKTTI
jgi:integrase